MHCVKFVSAFQNSVFFPQVKPRTASQIQQQHPPSVLHRPHTRVLRPPLSSCPLSRSAGRPSRSPRARTTVKRSCRPPLYLHLPLNRQVNLPSSPQADFQTPPSLLPRPPQLVPLWASNCSPSPPNQAKATPSSCPHLDESKILTSPERDYPFLLRPPRSNPLESGVQAKTPPNLPSPLLWYAAPCRTCRWTTPLCAGWPLRRPPLHLPSTSGPEAGLGRPAYLRLPVTLSERRMRMRKRVSRG